MYLACKTIYHSAPLDRYTCREKVKQCMLHMVCLRVSEPQSDDGGQDEHHNAQHMRVPEGKEAAEAPGDRRGADTHTHTHTHTPTDTQRGREREREAVSRAGEEVSDMKVLGGGRRGLLTQ